MTFISLGILVMALGASLLKGRPFGIKALKAIFIIATVAIFSLLTYYSYQQYQVWDSNELTKHFLNQKVNIIRNIDINYFVYYIGMRFFVSYLISLFAGIIFLFVAGKLNRKYEERFFEPKELWLGTLALFLVGWPGLMFYLVGLILVYLLVHVLCFMFQVSRRISLYYWWLPLAIFVIIINKWLVELGAWKLLKI